MLRKNLDDEDADAGAIIVSMKNIAFLSIDWQSINFRNSIYN